MGHRAYKPSFKTIGRYSKMEGFFLGGGFPLQGKDGGIFGVAQYPNRFKICLSTTVQNLVLVSQNAHEVSYAAPLIATSKFAYQDILDHVKFFNLFVSIRIVFQIGDYKVPKINCFINKLQGRCT